MTTVLMVWRISWCGGGDVVVGCGDEDGGFGGGWMVAMMLVTVRSFGWRLSRGGGHDDDGVLAECIFKNSELSQVLINADNVSLNFENGMWALTATHLNMRGNALDLSCMFLTVRIQRISLTRLEQTATFSISTISDEEVLLTVSRHPALSASENPVSSKPESFVYQRPKFNGSSETAKDSFNLLEVVTHGYKAVTSTTKPTGLLQPLPPPKAIWAAITMDFVMGLPPSHRATVIYLCRSQLFKHDSLQAVFGRDPLSHMNYLPGTTSNEAVDTTLATRKELIKELRSNLKHAQSKYKKFTDAKRRVKQFNKEDLDTNKAPLELQAIIQTRTEVGEDKLQYLVQWRHLPPEEVTWADALVFHTLYPDLDLKDKVSQKEDGDVRPFNEPNETRLEIIDNEVNESDMLCQGKRKKKGNPWLKDFVTK
ncbi:ty3-gypsy retrotransposon protein [Tanacetum coccineum]